MPHWSTLSTAWFTSGAILRFAHFKLERAGPLFEWKPNTLSGCICVSTTQASAGLKTTSGHRGLKNIWDHRVYDRLRFNRAAP